MRTSNLRRFELTEEQRPKGEGRKASCADGAATKRDGVLPEDAFHTILAHERRRSERSLRPFVLMLLESRTTNGNGAASVKRLTSLVSDAIRETDLIGWYEQGVILGVIFTEVNTAGKDPVTEVLCSKVVTALQQNLDRKLASTLVVTLHVFPESSDRGRSDSVADIRLYPDIPRLGSNKRLPKVLKRGIDIVASGALLLVLSPVLAAIALAIKLTSKGPIIFEQERLGQFGKRFKFLKFRSMFVNNDSRVHRDFVQRFIVAQAESEMQGADAPKVYKIIADPRVTSVGRFLRRTSLDELPQLWNVLRGEMSLVGPRPPVPYEFEVYASWHRRRVLEAKPGVTGLWQVTGRSRTTFDDMVRLDLRYAQNWSLWLDLKILLATPRAVLNGDGAF